MDARPQAVVAGGAGFIGSHLCERLLGEGYSVICLDNFCTGTADNVSHLAELGPFKLIRVNISEFIHIPGKVDVVVNLASPASPADYLQLPIETLKVGSIGTLHTLGLAREKKARYLLASTSETYGDPQIHPQPETYWGHVNPVGPRGVYDEAKRFGEALTMAYRRSHGVDTAIVRIFNTHGPRMRQADGRAVPAFVTQALRGEPITVSGDGSQTRSIQYVDDLIEGCMRLLHSSHSGPVNIGNPCEISIQDLALTIRDLAGSQSEIVYIDRPVDDPTVRQPDITLARELLGWAPEIGLEAGLRKTIEWFRQTLGGESRLSLAGRPQARSRPATPDSGHARRIAVVGAGYVGLTTSACLASLGHSVVCADSDADKVERLARGEVGIREPGLPELVAAGLRSGRLSFVRGARAAAAGAELVFLCVPTPFGGEGGVDVSAMESVIAECGQLLAAGCVVVNKSTVPVGMAGRVAELLGRGDLPVVSNPEFLREGSAVQDFLHPDRFVVGSDRPDAANQVAALYARLGAPVLVTDAASAELVKYAANCFLAMKVSFANAIADLCEELGADIGDVTRGVGYDSRIGSAFLAPGPGWGGSCLTKDTRALLCAAEAAGLELDLLRATIDANARRHQQMADKVRLVVTGNAAGSLAGRRIALLGLTFKAGTDDLRDSPALAVAGLLHQAGADLVGCDPAVAAGTELGPVKVVADAYAAAADAEAIVVLTEWAEFRLLDWTKIAESMRRRIVVDTRNLLAPADVHKAGIEWTGIGRHISRYATYRNSNVVVQPLGQC